MTSLLAFAGAAACTANSDDSPTHSVELVPLATIVAPGDSIDLATGMPAVASDGHIVVPLDDSPAGAVGVFDSAGRLVRRVGRAGDGPGEFRSVQSIGLGLGDSLWVIDNLYRAHVFAPPPLVTFARTIRFERPNTGRVTPFGILSAGVYTSAGLQSAHLVNWDGQLVREYGASAPAASVDDRLGSPAVRDTARVWVPYAKAYVLELLDAGGTVAQRIERRLSWFPPDSGARGFAWQAKPPPRIHAVNIGVDGNIWVLIRRANRAWKPQEVPGATRPDRPVEARRLGAVNFAELFEGVIEVLDPRDGRLIATRDVGGGVLGFPASDLIYEVTQDDVGRVSVQISRIALKPR
jgi:hypothetical protein